MRSRRPFLVGIVLLFLLFGSGCAPTAPAPVAPNAPAPTAAGTTISDGTPAPAAGTPAPAAYTPAPAPTGPSGTPVSASALITDSSLSALKIEADIPPMRVKHQVVIAISLYPTGGHILVSNVQVVKNATAVITNATPVGTPGNTLVNAFGSHRSVSATATLETSPDIFSVAPTGSQIKPLDLEKVVWYWTITPLIDGDQNIGVDIEAQWTSTLTGKQSLPYTLGSPLFLVNVQAVVPPSPPFDLTTLLSPMATIVSALIGALAALLALPSFRRWVRVRLRRSNKKSLTEPETSDHPGRTAETEPEISDHPDGTAEKKSP